MKSLNTRRELFSPIFTVWIKSRIQFLLIFNVFPTTVTVHSFTLVIKVHLGITIQTFQTQLLWWLWGEHQRYRGWDARRARGNRRRGVLKNRGTPEYLLLWGFNFTFLN